MQRKKGELLTARVSHVERRVQVTALRNPYVMGHVAVPQDLAQFSRNLRALKWNGRIVALVVEIRPYGKLSNTDQNKEDKRAREYEDEERFTNASILPEANEQYFVERFS